MTDDQSLERAARAWIEAGPTKAPDAVVEAALSRVATARQDRIAIVPTWLPRWGRVTRLVAIAALVIAGVVGGAMLLAGGTVPQLTNQPSPGVPSADASVGPPALFDLSGSFTSERYGYSLSIAPDWVTRQATLTWFGPDNSYPVVDEIDVTGTDTGLNGASQPLGPGESLDQWLVPFQANDGGLSLACRGGDVSTWPDVQVGDVIGRWQQMCNAAAVIAESGGRVYVFSWSNGTFDTNQHMTPEEFKRVLTTVRFDPSAAPPPPSPPSLALEFVSPRLGYSISYPGGWTVTPAIQTAPAGAIINYGDPTLDVLLGPDARLVIASQPLAAGQTPDDWVIHYCTLYESPGTDCDGAPTALPRIGVGSIEGWVMTDGNSTIESVADGGRLFDVLVAAGDRGYSFTLDGLVERPLMEALMASVSLDPGSAVDSP